MALFFKRLLIISMLLITTQQSLANDEKLRHFGFIGVGPTVNFLTDSLATTLSSSSASIGGSLNFDIILPIGKNFLAGISGSSGFLPRSTGYAARNIFIGAKLGYWVYGAERENGVVLDFTVGSGGITSPLGADDRPPYYWSGGLGFSLGSTYKVKDSALSFSLRATGHPTQNGPLYFIGLFTGLGFGH